MPLPCHCVDLRRFDFRGDYSTDKQLKRTIDTLVNETIITAAAEDVTDRVLNEALLKAKGGSYNRRFIMTSKKPPVAKSDEETAVESEVPTVPQGDTPLSPEVLKIVNTLSTIDEENSAVCSEKESLEEEIKKMISKISAFEFEPGHGKTVTEGKGDAEVVETDPAGREEICESQAVPDLLLHKDSSEERLYQEKKDDIAAWEEAVEVEIQIIGPSYEENTPIYYTETVTPYTSSMESISDLELTKEDICSHFLATDEEFESTELKHQIQEDGLSTQATSDELELEALAICTSMVVDIMSRVEETISANEANTDQRREVNVADALSRSEIGENDKHGEMHEDTSASEQIPMEVEEMHTTAPVMNTTEFSTEPKSMYGQISKEESEEEDMYDIESINVHSEEILEHNASHKSAELSDNPKKEGRDHELESDEKPKQTSTEHIFSNTTEMTAAFLSFQSAGETIVMTATAAHQEVYLSDTEADKLSSGEEKECYEAYNLAAFKEDTLVNPSSLSASKEWLKTEHLESFTAPTNIHYKMGNKVQSCDDILVATREPQLGSTVSLNNSFEGTEMLRPASVRSLDSVTESHFINMELEEIKSHSEQRENLNPSEHVDEHQLDEQETLPVTETAGTEDTLSASTSIALKCIDDIIETLDAQAPEINQNNTENYTEAFVHSEKKEDNITAASAFGDDNITDLFASISTIIEDGLEPTDVAKAEEEVCTGAKSSQELSETAIRSVQEDKLEDERPETAFLSSQEKSVPYCPHESSNTTELQKASEHKTKSNNVHIPSSTQDERNERKKNDTDSRKKPIPGETGNGKVYKTWKFGNKMKKLISSLKRKN